MGNGHEFYISSRNKFYKQKKSEGLIPDFLLKSVNCTHSAQFTGLGFIMGIGDKLYGEPVF